jgi:antitoxin YefM
MASESSYTNLRANLASVLDRVVDNREAVIVRRKGDRDVALLPASELAGLMETAHLMRPPKNARRLTTALRRAERGKPGRLRLSNCAGRPVLARRISRDAIFHHEFGDDLLQWVKSDRKIALRVLELVEATMRDPFNGIGKSERLRYILAGCWSRRIT